MKTIKIASAAVLIAITGITMATILSGNVRKSNSFKGSLPAAESYTAATAPGSTIQATDNVATTNQRIQLALILDTSNSMDGLIEQAKSQLWNIVNELAKAKRDSVSADVTIALYEYGNDGLSVTGGYIRKVLGFTNDLDLISEKLFTLTTNGGSEYCGKVLSVSLDSLDWTESDSALKVIYIAGNEEFTQGPVNYTTACSKAKAKKVVINTIFCGHFQQGISWKWQDGAQCGLGTYLNIDSDKQAIQVATPYDNQIIQLNTQLNNTYIQYGNKGVASKDNQIKQDENSGKYSSANTAKRAISKSSTMYKNESWDLVDAYEKDKTIVKTIDKTTLPAALNTKPDEEIEVVIKEKAIERSNVKKEIADLAVKREEYIKTVTIEKTGEDNTLGATMVKTIKEQASKKGFVFEK